MEKFFDLISRVLNSKRNRDAIDAEFVRKLSNAVLQTQKQIESDEIKTRDRQAEHDIAILWDNLANDFLTYDHPDAYKLHRLCIAKSGYWLSEEIWTQHKVEKLDIDFVAIKKQINRMKKNIHPQFVNQ